MAFTLLLCHSKYHNPHFVGKNGATSSGGMKKPVTWWQTKTVRDEVSMGCFCMTNAVASNGMPCIPYYWVDFVSVLPFTCVLKENLKQINIDLKAWTKDAINIKRVRRCKFFLSQTVCCCSICHLWNHHNEDLLWISSRCRSQMH